MGRDRFEASFRVDAPVDAVWERLTTFAGTPYEGDPGDPADLGAGKSNAFAIGVDRISQPLFRHRGQHLAANQLDVVIAPATVLCGHGVGAQECGLYGDAGRVLQCPGNAQQPQFTVQIETITGFDLDRRNPFLFQRQQPTQGLRCQVLVSGSAGRINGRHDASAGPRNILVTCALKPLFELRCTIAGKYQVGMAVDQCRRQPLPTERTGRGSVGRRQLRRPAHPGNTTVSNRQRSIFDDAERRRTHLHGGNMRVAQQQIPMENSRLPVANCNGP